MLTAAALCFNVFILLCQQITEVHPSTVSRCRKKILERNAFIPTTLEIEQIEHLISKESINRESESILEKIISRSSSLPTASVQVPQGFTATSIRHKRTSAAPFFVEGTFQATTTVSSTNQVSGNPLAEDDDDDAEQRGLTSNTSVCNYTEYNITLTKANTFMNNLKKQYFNIEPYRSKLENLSAYVNYLDNCSNNNHSDWKVFQKDYLGFKEEFDVFQKELFIWKTVLKYIDPVLYAIIITMGVGGNGMLVIIFVRHPVILTSPNIVVLVIAICDILALLFIAPLDYITEFYGADFLGHVSCKIYIYLRLTIRSVTEMCLVMLSGQRFLSTISLGRRGTLKARLESPCFIWTLMVAVCIFSAVFCIPAIFVIEFTDGTCFPHIKSNAMAQLFFFFIVTFFVILPFPMVIFNGLTALRLGRTTKEDFPHTRMSRLILPRYRSARVITIVAIFYASVFIPRTLWDASVSWRHLNRRSILYFSIDQVINFLYFADSCSMPFILFFLSSVYRKLFRQFWQYEYYRCTIRTNTSTS